MQFDPIRLGFVAAVVALLATLAEGQGPPASPNTIRAKLTSPLSSEADDLLQSAIEALGQAGFSELPEIIDALADGEITIVELDSIGSSRDLGTHDHDTIAIDTDGLSIGEIGSVLLHEWRHAKSAMAAETEVDPETTGQPFDESMCKHAEMYVESAWDLCDSSYHTLVYCDEIADASYRANSAIDLCYVFGGSTDAYAPNPYEDCNCAL